MWVSKSGINPAEFLSDTLISRAIGNIGTIGTTAAQDSIDTMVQELAFVSTS